MKRTDFLSSRTTPTSLQLCLSRKHNLILTRKCVKTTCQRTWIISYWYIFYTMLYINLNARDNSSNYCSTVQTKFRPGALGALSFYDPMGPSSNKRTVWFRYNEQIRWSASFLISRVHVPMFHIFSIYGCVRLASLGRPRATPLRSNSLASFQGLTWVSFQCPAWGVVTWGWPEVRCDRSISSCQGLTRVSTAGSTQGS